jgi:hypothetical protein
VDRAPAHLRLESMAETAEARIGGVSDEEKCGARLPWRSPAPRAGVRWRDFGVLDWAGLWFTRVSMGRKPPPFCLRLASSFQVSRVHNSPMGKCSLLDSSSSRLKGKQEKCSLLSSGSVPLAMWQEIKESWRQDNCPNHEHMWWKLEGSTVSVTTWCWHCNQGCFLENAPRVEKASFFLF